MDRKLFRSGIYEEFQALELKDLNDIEDVPLKFVKKYIGKLEDVFTRGVGLFLWGKNGRGKTSSAVVILKEASKAGYSVQLISLAGAKDLFAQGWYDTSKKDLFSRRVREVDFLAIDEVGKDESPLAVSMLENLVRYRTQRKLPTIVVSNNDFAQIAAKYTESLCSMLKGNFFPVHFGGPKDLRDKKVTSLKEFLAS